MSPAEKNKNRLSQSSLSDTFFKIAYSAIQIFIFIGEISKKIIYSPYLIGKLILSVFYLLKDFFIRHVLNQVRNILKKISLRKAKIKIALPSIPKFPSLPKLAKILPPAKIIEQLKLIKLPKLPSFPKIPKIAKISLKIRPLDFLSIKLRYFILGSLITLSIVFLYQSYAFLKSLPSPSKIGKINYPLSTHIVDRNGKLLYEIYREQNRTPIKLKDLPSFVYQAAIAIEDKDFYRHKGISIISGIVRAAKDTVLKGNLQGGSTITQQLVKSALLTPERTVKRKIKEIILALWAEQLFSKDQILEMYLNQVPYGGSSYGIEEAAKTYFGKQAIKLTLSEAALLAGLPQAPSYYSPFSNPELAKWRRNDVLDKMYSLKFITSENFKKAKNETLSVVTPKTKIYAPHFVFFIKSYLEERYGIRQVEEGGLRVQTTLDFNIQDAVEKILTEELEKIKNLNVSNGAVLITRPQTGEILAMVGSVDYFTAPSGAFNVTAGLRQPGSAIKPLMYSLALQKGYTAASILEDSPIVFKPQGSTEIYSPINYDGKFHGRIPLRYALANSYNVPAVKVLNTLGVANFIDHASKMGISTWTDRSRFGLSLTLGGGEVTMLDMAESFGVLANQGYKVDLSGIAKLENSFGNSIYQMGSLKHKTLDEGTAFIISDILSDNFARQWAFGTRSSLEIPGYKVAVKTGTTNDKKDNWTIGYTPEFLVTVWVGNNDGKPMNPYLTSGITGAAPIWNKVMSYLLKNYGEDKVWFAKPDNIVERICYYGRTEYFSKGTEKTSSCRESLGSPTPTPTPN